MLIDIERLLPRAEYDALDRAVHRASEETAGSRRAARRFCCPVKSKSAAPPSARDRACAIPDETWRQITALARAPRRDGVVEWSCGASAGCVAAIVRALAPRTSGCESLWQVGGA